jgi:hypothetical protein
VKEQRKPRSYYQELLAFGLKQNLFGRKSIYFDGYEHNLQHAEVPRKPIPDQSMQPVAFLTESSGDYAVPNESDHYRI